MGEEVKKKSLYHVAGLNTTMLTDVRPAIDWMASLFAQGQDVEKFKKDHQLALISLFKDLQSAIQDFAFNNKRPFDEFIKKYNLQQLEKVDVSLVNSPLVFFDNLPHPNLDGNFDLRNKPCSVALGRITRIGDKKQVELQAFGVNTFNFNSERILLPGKHYNEADYQIGYLYPQSSIMFCRLPVNSMQGF